MSNDALGIVLTGRPGRRNTVRQENDAVVDDFFHAAVVDEIEVVVCMQVDHAGQYRVGLREVDDIGRAHDLLLNIGINFHNLAISNDDATVRSAFITDAIEQPATTNDKLPFLRLYPLSLRELRNYEEQKWKDSFHSCHRNFCP